MNGPQDHNQPTGTVGPCEELRELLPAYSIGATTEEETRRVRTLLEQCPEVAADLGAYAALSEVFYEQVEPVEPPAALHDRLMAAIGDADTHPADTDTTADTRPSPPADDTSPFARVDAARTDGRRRIHWLAWAGLAAACVALVITNVYWISRLNDVRGQVEALRRQQQDIVTLASAREVQRVVLTGTQPGSETAALASVLWNPESQRAWLFTDELPPLPPDQTYQLWLIDDQGPVSAGTFRPDTDGQGLHAFEAQAPLPAYSLIGISVEPASGSEAPTTDPIAVGEV